MLVYIKRIHQPQKQNKTKHINKKIKQNKMSNMHQLSIITFFHNLPGEENTKYT